VHGSPDATAIPTSRHHHAFVGVSIFELLVTLTE
jgi:hypothetical protein